MCVIPCILIFKESSIRWKETLFTRTVEHDDRVLQHENRENCKMACINENTFTCKHVEFGQFIPEFLGTCFLSAAPLAETTTFDGTTGMHVYEPEKMTFSESESLTRIVILHLYTCICTGMCPGEAWVKRGSFCYLVSCDVGNMQYARAQCASYEATLTSVHDMNEGLFIDWLVRNEAGVDSTTCNAGHMYIGLSTNNNGSNQSFRLLIFIVLIFDLTTFSCQSFSLGVG